MFLLYLIFFFLILRFTVTLFNFISNPKLTSSGKHYDDLVSILIPSHNDTDDVITLLQSIKAQDYRYYEVIVIQKQSISPDLVVFCGNYPRFKIVNTPDTPPGWTERNFTCHYLSTQAKGKYLMFLDARSIVANGLINNSVHRMNVQRLTLLSLFSNQIMLSAGERILVPLINYLLLNLVPLRLIRLSKNPVFSIISRQFMMFETKSYNEFTWHAAVKDKTDGDFRLMKQIKGYGLHAEVLLANRLLYCRMFSNFKESVLGLSRIIIPYFGSFLALFLYILLVFLGPVAIALYMSTELLLFAVTLIILSRVMISLASQQNPWLNILLHPVQMISLMLVAVLAVPLHFTKTTAWKQRDASP